MRDPYTVLGVARDAGAGELRHAYRRLAKLVHPDRNPGRDTAAAFHEVAVAYDFLADPARRRRYDAGEIDAAGQGRAAAPDLAGVALQEDTVDPYELFDRLFANARSARPAERGADISCAAIVDFVTAARGGWQRLTLPGGRVLDVAIPAGIEGGRTLRLKRQGEASDGDGPPGDAYVTIAVEPHPLFAREGDDVRVTLPVTLAEAVAGARVEVPTLDGPVTLAIPPHSNSGTVLRLRARGLGPDGARGDLLVTLAVTLPDPPDAALDRFVAEGGGAGYDPRPGLGGG